MKPMKLEMDKFIYVGCIPVKDHPERPTDQSFCIERDCPHCKNSMWVSEKKRFLEQDLEDVRIYCLECLVIASLSEGLEPTLFDIGKI